LRARFIHRRKNMGIGGIPLPVICQHMPTCPVHCATASATCGKRSGTSLSSVQPVLFRRRRAWKRETLLES
jgi:hypothetical protein